MIIKLRPRLAVSLGCAVVLFMSVGVALAQEDRQSDSDQRKKENDQSNPRQLESFELQHRNPQELQQILSLRWQRTAAVLGQPAIGQPQRLTTGFRGTADDKPIFAADQENRLLFVRGSEEQINEIKALVDAFDVKEEEIKSHEFGNVKLIPILNERAGPVASILGQLRLDHRLIPMQNVALVAVCQDESGDNEQQAEQVRQVISKLKADEGIDKSDNGGENRDDSSEDRSP